MKVGIDARCLGTKICGVSRYTQCLLQALSQSDTHNEYIVYTNQLEYIPGLGDNFRVSSTAFSRMNPLCDRSFCSKLAHDKLDIFHSMHSWLPLWLPKEIKSIVTIHDLFAITDPLFFIHRKPFHNMVRRYFKCLLARTLKHSSAVVTISQYCKKEIEQNFNFSKPIEVIYNSPGLVSENFKKQNHVDMNEKYLFYLGNFRSYKNVEVLLRGFRLFLQMRPNVNIKLVLAGNDLGDSMKILSKQLSIEECVKFIYKPSDEQICSLYQNSVAFIFPSKYEGFGIPPLEAMSFGIPVIISDADALVETSGSAAAIFDRNDPQGLAKTICKVIEDDCFRVQLIESGYRTYKLYNWNTSAVQLLRFYEVIMSNNY